MPCHRVQIDKRESFFVNFGSVRAIVEPGFENTLFIDYNKVLKHGKVCRFLSSIKPGGS